MKDLNALDAETESCRVVSRRETLRAMAAMAGGALLFPEDALANEAGELGSADEEFLNELERLGCLFFWEQGS